MHNMPTTEMNRPRMILRKTTMRKKKSNVTSKEWQLETKTVGKPFVQLEF